MGRYMNVMLKKQNRDDIFILMLNEELKNEYGANTATKFNPWCELQEEANFMNKDREGKKQCPGLKRPVTTEHLSKNFFWFRNAFFSIKLSGGTTADEGKDAVAVCKWIIKTNSKYIDTEQSDNYDMETVAEYLNSAFEEAGYNLDELWKM
ncbi:MAG: hypothetical protein L0G39_12990 [Chryseobacterium sp.]|nr:hypothetical protein [Chryseobacterium sp.]MDN5480228.1 hypothetical protein [Chryseobacterium sp.]